MSAPAEACASGGCATPVYVKKWGVCRRHYNELRDQGVVKKPPKSACSFDGCPRDAESRGLCSAHNAQRKRGSDLKPVVDQRTGEPAADQLTRTCNVPSRWTGLPCGKPASRSGQCPGHMAVYSELVRS